MEIIKQLNVFYHEKKVGTLAAYKDGLAAFEYDQQWIAEGFSVSPFSLPISSKVFVPKIDPFDGLFGVFADSLPDGWGRFLLDRLLLKNRIDPHTIGKLYRLSIVGSSGMGALTYEPARHFETEKSDLDLDQIAEECGKILETDFSEDLDKIFSLGGSSGGARPKILTRVDGEDWIIKFPSSQDSKKIGLQEYHYSLCAKECGIQMEETKLFPSKQCAGYFGTKRFDRRRDENGKIERIHMLSVSGILETSHRVPNLDYTTLMKLTLEITKDFLEVEKLYRLMCFNVFAHNQDDHSKNFSYLYEEQENCWVLSPAYDLTYSYSLGGEHATTVFGNGKDPGINDLLEVAAEIGMNRKHAKILAEEIRDCVQSRLEDYL
ncbi:type II toxin-antitoxin system HipA family toxin [Anaerovorax odorimutans]|uniref:Type II toxin-antitoxin system HipA family toxin n=1 Tax=Anaerovorax odorimutans TaxID=109327 RepID=A0ABT1RQL6_9FIRM|nr:type II toxin-antitoxin system HipA family toxin [Anaerovorax odorimutans]MCQ4637449.1 type II toxin-antitoxin system HipA family toxin [Anaerovorax odorimutans]